MFSLSLSLCLSVVFLFVLLAAVAAISLGNWVAFARRQLDIIFIQRIRNVSSSSPSSPFFHFLKHLFCGVVNNFGFSCASTILFRLTSKSERQRERGGERGGEREWEKSNKLSMSLFVIFVYATGASLYVDRYFSRYFHAMGDGILSNLKLANNAFELVKLKVCRSVSPTPLPANYVRYYGQILMSLSARGAR